MLRAISDSLFDFLIDAFPANSSYAREDFEQDPMPPLLAHFLTQTLHHRLDTEVEQLRGVRTTWFDYDHEEVQRAYKHFVASLANHSIIPEEEWRGTLKRASKVVLAHLILPAHTLVEFVFRDDEQPLMAPVIYKQLSYFAAYPYLREAVETFMTRRGMDQIDRNRFASLLSQIDRHMTAEFSSDDWLRLLRPLFDLMNRIPETRGQGVPIELLSMYFGDKDAYDIQGRLQVEKEVRRVSSLNEESLRKVLDGSVEPFEQAAATTLFAPAPEPEEPAREPEPVAVKAPAADPTPVEAPPPPSVAKAPAHEQKPLWQQFQQANGGSKPSAPPAAQPASPAPQPDAAVPLWQRFQKPADAKKETPPAPARENGHVAAPARPQPAPQAPATAPAYTPTLQDLAQLERQVLGAQGMTNRSVFIEHLFMGSSADYAKTLNELRHVPDWAQASQLIADRVFKRHQVNIYSPAALMFTESVEAQYRKSR
ncbi:MAG: hypothetical protein R2834_15980 [Rhodothermales bacterium]